MVSWDPAAYARFAAERSRPFDDLVRRIGASRPGRVVDLGCGAGDLTASLARRWPAAQVVGVDSSPTMLQKAAGEADAPDLDGRLSFVEADLADWTPDAAVDVIVTNAALQWVPQHLDLLSRWVDALAPGGWLALQVPGNFAAPSHALMREVAAEPPFEQRLAGVLRGPESVAQPSAYATLLADLGCVVDAWETTYVQVLDPEGQLGDDAVLAWVSGTGLRPVLDALADEPELRGRFVDAYSGRLRAAYPRQPWGTLLPFRRVFCVAHLPEEVAA
ncbi:trans-aconitate 2-methyltransferase [Angustibacter sp. Root456]|uniref:trans-aconitate 2-methyltransferase n=1 Tax=Angustibacter sp. Root456 TaxID=1736539 RepID=UPI0006F2E372|nr:trans-aconitate 2-methyltransferase [Angustibacter sp. Root456]KQX62896.1 trans-aconitate methyltransferase [Angustibacter sp. Root456]